MGRRVKTPSVRVDELYVRIKKITKNVPKC